VDVDEAEQEAAGAPVVPPPWAKQPRRDRTVALTVVLLVVGLVFAAGAVFFKLGYDDAADSTSNTALLDVAKTAQVKDQVSKATEALFSYDYNNIKKTEDAANGLLANDSVKAKYNSLMGEVKRLAPQQKMVVTCKVTRSAVIMLNGDLARVMVFVDQTSTRADTKQTTAGSAQLHVDAQLQGDTWKITDLDTYKAPPPPAANAPASSAPASPPPSK
jgi:Mce-associated membrane protein